jgi:thioredoxin-like negative regulator of GroEL
VEKDRPLVIDFGTENCYWCKQLDLRTFRDAAVVGLMNGRFIPLKIDAQREAELSEKLRIQSYPTIVLAAPDGKILGTLEGFMEAPRFLEQLQRALASVSSPEWMARDYQEATKAIAASDYSKAVALLKVVLEDRMERPVQLKARQLLQDLEQQAGARLARARQLVERGQSTEAIDTVTELVRSFAGTAAAAEGGQLLARLTQQPEIKEPPRLRRARELLAQAREEYRGQQFLACLDRCELLTTHFSDLPEGAQAMQLAAEIRNNPEWLKLACDALSDRLSQLYLALAEACLRSGQPQQAIAYLERIVQTFPNTRQAEAAQIRLLQIQGEPTRPVDFKKD